MINNKDNLNKKNSLTEENSQKRDNSISKLKLSEEISIKRLGKGEKKKVQKKKTKKPSSFVKMSNKYFAENTINLFNENKLQTLERDLLKSNMNITATSYLSAVLTSTVISFPIAVLIVLLLGFFLSESFFVNIAKTFWLVLFIPFITFLGGYLYPSLEKSSVEEKIDEELPFATINMSAISGSMVEPSKMFSIILSLGDYKALEKEFTKVINGINIYGYNLVGSLRIASEKTASKKLSELFNSMSTTITSGGNLIKFFEKRSRSLLFDYKLEREKRSKNAETFMDIYISVVIAAPMIFMLIFIIMGISGFGIELTTSQITLLMVLGVSLINALFIIFLSARGS